MTRFGLFQVLNIVVLLNLLLFCVVSLTPFRSTSDRNN